MMRATLRPLHLLALGHPLVDDDVDRGLSEGCGDPLAVPPALPIVGDGVEIVGDVDRELRRQPDELFQPVVRVASRLYRQNTLSALVHDRAVQAEPASG